MFEPIFALALAAGLALTHVAATWMRFLDGIPRSRWLSFAGGVATSYVFLHLLPDLAEHHEVLSGLTGGSDESDAELCLAYICALAGLVTFYGLERSAKVSRSRHAHERVEHPVLVVHLLLLAAYNLLISYLLTNREARSTEQELFFRRDGDAFHHRRFRHATGSARAF